MVGRISDMSLSNCDLTAHLAVSEAREGNTQKRIASASRRIAKLEADMPRLMEMVTW